MIDIISDFPTNLLLMKIVAAFFSTEVQFYSHNCKFAFWDHPLRGLLGNICASVQAFGRLVATLS